MSFEFEGRVTLKSMENGTALSLLYTLLSHRHSFNVVEVMLGGMEENKRLAKAEYPISLKKNK